MRAKHSRRGAIAERIISGGPLEIDELADLFSVSSMTIYRDVLELERIGVLVRNRGTVSAVATSLLDTSASFRCSQNLEEKGKIARAAAKLLRPGQSVMVDDSTTALVALRECSDLSPLTVVTHSLAVAKETAENPLFKLVMAGGRYESWADSFYGAATEKMLSSMRVDACILSCSGVADSNTYHPHEEVAELKRTILKSAGERILLVDSSKFGRRALRVIAPLHEYTTLVTDQISDEDRQMVADCGLNLIIAK